MMAFADIGEDQDDLNEVMREEMEDVFIYDGRRDGWLGGWMDGWLDEWVGGAPGATWGWVGEAHWTVRG